MILAATGLAYLNSLQNAFLWDDLYLIVDNPQIKDWRNVVALFSSDLFPKVMPSHYYRPVQALTNLADYLLWGLAPFGFHATNTLIHAATAVLLYRLAAVLLRDRRAAVIAAVLFAVHPIHTEAVTYISGRSDTLAAFFMLAAIHLFLRSRTAGAAAWRGLSAGAFLLALLAREAAAILVLLIPLIDMTLRRRDGADRYASWKARSLEYLPYLLVLPLYGAMRVAAIGAATVPVESAQTPLPLRLLTMLQVVVEYLGLLLVPLKQHMERQVPVAQSIFDPLVFRSALVIAAILIAAWACRQRAWPVAFGIAWFFVALLPVSNLLPLATYMAEHWLYVPSMGLFIAAGWGLNRLALRGRRPTVTTAVSIAVVVYGGLTMRRNTDWKDGLSIYAATVRLAPQSARVWSNLGHAYQESGQTEKAKDAYEHALALTAGDGGALASNQHALVGNIYREQKRYDDALRAFNAAIGLDAANVSAYNNMALTFGALGRNDEAKQAFETALRLYPDFAAAHSNLGNLYFRNGDLGHAQTEYLAAIQLNPDYAEAYNNLGSVYFRSGRAELAADAYRTALRINPRLDEVRHNLEVVTQSRGSAAP